MLFSKPKSQLGVDIGTADIKIVQLRPQNDQFVLETYGIVDVSYQISSKDSGAAIIQNAKTLKALMQKAKVTTNKVVASLANSSVFTSVIQMPKIPKGEMRSAVEFEARKYVPLPLSEVALSWSILEDNRVRLNKDTNLGSLNSSATSQVKNRILLTAVPNVVIDNYVSLFKQVGLQPQALEIEALSLIRSVLSKTEGTVLLIDIGAKSTSLNLVQDGYLLVSKNLNVGGDTITTSIAQSLAINFARAEQFKKDFGLNPTAAHQIPQVMRPILDLIKNEAAQLMSLYESRGARVNKILFTGGSSKLPSLKEFFASLGRPVELSDPWSRIIYPPDLKPIIAPFGNNLAVAMGLAMRQMD